MKLKLFSVVCLLSCGVSYAAVASQELLYERVKKQILFLNDMQKAVQAGGYAAQLEIMTAGCRTYNTRVNVGKLLSFPDVARRFYWVSDLYKNACAYIDQEVKTTAFASIVQVPLPELVESPDSLSGSPDAAPEQRKSNRIRKLIEHADMIRTDVLFDEDENLSDYLPGDSE